MFFMFDFMIECGNIFFIIWLSIGVCEIWNVSGIEVV